METTIRAILIVAVCFVFGCGRNPSSDVKGKSESQDMEGLLLVENAMNETLELLAVKYSIDVEILVELLADYEQHTSGGSVTDFVYIKYHPVKTHVKSVGTRGGKPVLPISKALAELEKTYKIPQTTIAAILLDKNTIERVSDLIERG